VNRIGPLLVLVTVPACGGAGPARAPVPERSDWKPVAQALDSAIAAGAAPGAVLAVSAPGQHWYLASGRLGQGLDRVPDARTLYDLASLSKVGGLTTAMMPAVQEGRIALAGTTPLDTLPRTRYLYSDLGAIVLTQAVEAVYGERLDHLPAARVFGPLGMRSAGTRSGP